MVKVNTNSNTIKVNAASAGRASNLSIGTPQSYYDGLAKEWAISDNLVQGIDYSSKYYANIAKSNADSSKANLDSVRDAAEEVIAAKDNALNDISDAKINTLESLIDEGNNQIELIKEQGSSYATKEDAKYTAGNGIDITDNIISNTQTSAEWGNITGNIENQEDLVNYVKKYSGGLEVCDIGMSLYIDETKGLRRWLNGQIVAINQNTQGFLTRLKKIVALYPSLLTTEENWQAAKTLSDYGQVGKFVFNYAEDEETVESVRLPAVVNVQGLLDLQNLGMTVKAGLPNIEGSMNYASTHNSPFDETSGCIKRKSTIKNLVSRAGNADYSAELTVDASSSNPIFGASDTVQEEAIQYPYFIQIATGQETEVNITNEIELNNPFFFGMSQYFDVEPNNLSWLKSDGMYKPKSVYPDYYNWILENVNKGVEGFKGQEGYCFIATDSSGYYWWVSTESPVVGASVYRYDAGVNSMFFDGTVETLTSNGFTFTSIFEGSSYTVTRDSSKDTSILHPTAWITDYDFVINTSDETFKLPLKNGTEGMFGGGAGVVPSGWALYYYVGETVQNANLIDAGRIEEQLATKTDMLQASGAGMPSDRYIDLTLGASGATYTAPASGANGTYVSLVNFGITDTYKYATTIPIYNTNGVVLLPVKKNDKVIVNYNAAGRLNRFVFIYAEGEQ